MKKWLICLLVLCLLATVASADVLLELDDDFWETHQEECEYLYRAYTVNGKDGYAALWESPVSSRQRETVPNGEQVSGNWLYTADGETWLAVQSGEINNQGYEVIRGWIRLSDCVAVPDYLSFEAAYGEEFVPFDPAYSDAFDGVPEAILWSYPGSGVVEADGVDTRWWTEGTSAADAFDTCWFDSEGRFWGYTAYCYGIRNTWVCLSDPGNAEIPADPAVQEKLTETDIVYPAAEELPEPSGGVTALTVGLVAGVAVVSALLIVLLFRKRKRTS